ncbi:ABC transporter permease [Rhodoferax mekongensis]|uniref:ABC transporter permease n=1 Tax=Rhodoferax mekongensis TaxID=3068341 RepID=A0ABZ0AVF4_9BURK|nr:MULTISPECIES: ABC transporter permease [unclassified Rhodoferax]MDT7515593.1 ABC transporter permease [Rhodoferax sp. TBRC 17199]WNO03596.1 ABC transporter permease [Rhodoferax sp. TBRC 17307]
MNANYTLPRWADLVLLPAVCLAVALLAAAGVVALVGQDPAEVLSVLVNGAFGSQRGISYTLYYATTFIFTGLAVAVAFHGGLFNIGGEGQAILGGLGTGLVALWLSNSLPAWAMLPLMLVSGALFGAAWAAVPAYLQAYRGSHVVITTIMFNFIASSLLVYLLVNVLRPAGSMAVETAAFAASAKLPSMQDALAAMGIEWDASPLNTSLILALLASLAVYLFLWRTRAGYRLRAVGSSQSAAEYAGINVRHQIVIAMAISGALAGMVGMNEIAGVNGKLLLEFVSGAGFTGIAVALMGRNHPVGIIFASVLFGALFQGGAEVAFEVPGFSREMVVMLQGFIVLFSGAMVYVIAPVLAWVLGKISVKGVKSGVQHG